MYAIRSYYVIGLKLYDILSGSMNIGKSTIISKKTALDLLEFDDIS